MTSQQPYWCSKPTLLELKLFSSVKARIDASHENENTLYRLLFFSVVKTTEHVSCTLFLTSLRADEIKRWLTPNQSLVIVCTQASS